MKDKDFIKKDEFDFSSIKVKNYELVLEGVKVNVDLGPKEVMEYFEVVEEVSTYEELFISDPEAINNMPPINGKS